MILRQRPSRRAPCENLPAGVSSAPRRSRFILPPFQPLLHPEARLRTPANSGPAATFMVRQIRPSRFTHSTTPSTWKRNLDVGLLSICLFLRLALMTANDRASLFVYGSGQTGGQSDAEPWVFAGAEIAGRRCLKTLRVRLV